MSRPPTTPFPTSLRELQRKPSLRSLLSTARTHLLLTPFDPTILLRVLNHLSRADKASLLRLNTAFYWLVLPLISTHIVLSDTPWPRLRPVVRPPREFCDWLETHPPSSWVRQVNVYPHASTRCMVHHYEHEVDTEHAPRTLNCPERLPFLSRVQTLRIHGALHTDSDRWHGLTAQCAALQNVRARKLVLVGAPSSTPLTSLPYAVLAAVDEYVLVLSEAVEARSIANDLANMTVKRATLIFAAEPWMPLRANEHNWVAFFAELGRQLVHFPIHLRIVNAGDIKVGREWDISRSEAYLESHLRDALRAEQAEYRPWRRPRCEIEFVSMATYLLDAPEDELGPERLAKWRISLLSKGSLKRPPISLSQSPKTRRPAPLKPASRIMSLRTQSGPGSPIASMAHAVARRASDKMAERGEKRLARRTVSEKLRWDENVRLY